MSVRTDNNFIMGNLCALGCEILYGLSYVFTKQATNSASWLGLLGWRFFIAALVINICVFAGLIKINLRGRSIRPILKLALFFPVIYFTGETMGIRLTTASESGVFIACIPVISLIMSALILRKKPAKNQTAGVLTALAGVIITVVAVGTGASLSKSGYICLTIAVFSFAYYSVLVEKNSEYTGWELTYVMLMTGAAVFCAAALIEAGAHGETGELLRLPFRNRDFLTAVLYQGIGCSIAAFFLTNMAISKVGVNRMSSYIGVCTVVSIVSGTLVLHERFTAYQIIGAVVIVAGVYVANGIGKSVNRE